jgi:hypothetical protein
MPASLAQMRPRNRAGSSFLLSERKNDHHPSDGTNANIAAHFNAHGPDISRILPMAFLSPKITEAILTGQQPIDLSIAKLTRMLDLPVGWKDQHAILMN